MDVDERAERKAGGHSVLWWDVSTCVNPQTDREGHVYVWRHNNRMNKSFFPSLADTKTASWFEPVQIT